MSKLYIFAIGGSGSRVLRSLCMLLASGVTVGDDVVPMIIDPDASNGDLERTSTLLRLYESIHNQLHPYSNSKSKFFHNDISSLNKDGNYLLPLNGTAGINFDKYLDLGTMSMENQAFTKMLFSNENLASLMDVGFKGNPNIGSVVLNQFAHSNVFINFEQNFVAGDKVFIISSIFGGTGASGFPLLLKKLRTSSNTALKQAPIGAVSLLPYFNLKVNNLKDNKKSAIQSDSFITKTKAALHYYERNVTGNATINDMYYLGDSFTGYSYDNIDGGDDQKNDAHLVELLAALSIINFAPGPFAYPIVTKFHEYGLLSTTNNSVTFSDFGQQTLNIIQRPLVMMALLNSYLNNRDIDHRLSQKWSKERKGILGKEFFKSKFFIDYNSFKKNFEEWLTELARNQIHFDPFNSDTDLVKADGLTKVKGITPIYPGINPFKKKGYDLIDLELGERINSIQSDASAQDTFMELIYTVLSDICNKNLNI